MSSRYVESGSSPSHIFGRQNSVVRLICTASVAILILRYLHWRLTETLPAPEPKAAVVWAYTFLTFELLAALATLSVLFFLSRTRTRRQEAIDNKDWVARNDPSVAILIPTYNEDRRILERSILGALSQDHANCRVYVLDDNRREWLQDLCMELGARYLTRKDNSGAKAGNMNAGLKWIEADGGRPEFIAVLDADFVAFPRFVTQALALFHDPSVGLVQTPQHFFNADPFQHAFRASNVMPDEQRFFFDTIMPSKDAWGTAFSCGTSAIIRQGALKEVGGFPTESVTEDMLLSLKLKNKGWKTVYLDERLSVGLAPEGVAEYITQRARWCLGLMQIARGPVGPFSRSRLRLIDRLSILDALGYWALTFPFRFLCIAAPIAYWFTGWTVIHAELSEIALFLLPALAAHVVLLGWISGGRVLPILSDANQFLVAPEAIKSTIKGLVAPSGHAFSVTAKGGNRNRTFIHWPVMRRLLVLLTMTIAGLAYAHASPFAPHLEGAPYWFTAFWSAYNILILLVACMTCIELPRRADERLVVSEPCRLHVDGKSYDLRLKDLSPEGAQLAGVSPLSAGDAAQLELLGEAPLRVRIVWNMRASFAVRFTEPHLVRRAMIRKLFSGAYGAPPQNVHILALVSAVARGLLSYDRFKTMMKRSPQMLPAEPIGQRPWPSDDAVLHCAGSDESLAPTGTGAGQASANRLTPAA